MNSTLREECRNQLACNFTKKNPVVENALLACKIQFKLHNCENLAQKNPEVAKNLLSCDLKKFCEQNSYSDLNEGLACLQGLDRSIIETVEMLKGLLNSAWRGLEKASEAQKEFFKICEKNIHYKRELVRDLPSFAKLSDAKLKEHPCPYLMTQVRNAANFETQRLRGLPRKNMIPLEEPSASSSLSPSDHARINALWETAQALLKEKTDTLACVNPTASKEMRCYAFLSLVDPFAVVAGAGKLFRTQKLLKDSSVERHLARAITEEAFLKKYVRYSPTTKEQNQRWMNLAEKNNLTDVKNFEVENSVMKDLNDNLNNKNLVTGLTNFHKSLLHGKIDALTKELRKKYPDLEVYPYSDFKASGFTFKGQAPPDLENQLQKLFQETNQEFTDFVTKNNLVKAADNPQNWMRGGYSDNPDLLSLTTRHARETEGNRMQSSSSLEVQSALYTKLNKAERLRVEINSELAATSMIEKTAHGKILHPDAFDILRKNDGDLAQSQTDLIQRFGLRELPLGSVQKMQDYVKSVNYFSMGNRIPERLIANLDEAVHGGLTADMIGMGSQNLRGTAEALAQSKTVKQAATNARQAEKAVTAEFQVQRQAFQDIVKGVLGPHRVRTVCSGDDCVAIPTGVLRDNEKQQILQRLSQSGYSSKFRLSFVPENIPNTNMRTQMSVHGESIEKYLRKNLSASMEPNKLKGLTFGVDMKTQEINSGSVKLLMGQHPDVSLSGSEQQLIQENFKRALQQMNDELKKQGMAANYHL